MKNLLESWNAYLAEDKKDPLYKQKTFNMFVLLRIDTDKGGNRDQIKNDLRAIPEVLTARVVEPHEGGVQKDFGTHSFSTMKLRVRVPPEQEEYSLAARIATDINTEADETHQWRRGIHVKDWRTEVAKELREYGWQSSEHKKDLKRDSAELTKGGPQKKGGAPFNRSDPESDWESAPPGAPGGLEEGEDWDAFKNKLQNVADVFRPSQWKEPSGGKPTPPPKKPETSPVDWEELETSPVDWAEEAGKLNYEDIISEPPTSPTPPYPRSNPEDEPPLSYDDWIEREATQIYKYGDLDLPALDPDHKHRLKNWRYEKNYVDAQHDAHIRAWEMKDAELIGNDIYDFRVPMTDTAYGTSPAGTSRINPVSKRKQTHGGVDFGARINTKRAAEAYVTDAGKSIGPYGDKKHGFSTTLEGEGIGREWKLASEQELELMKKEWQKEHDPKDFPEPASEEEYATRRKAGRGIRGKYEKLLIKVRERIYAPMNFEVTKIKSDPYPGQKRGLGNTVEGRYYNNRTGEFMRVIFAHMPEAPTHYEVGAVLKRDDMVGRIGKTGHADGKHLHMEIRKETPEETRNMILRHAETFDVGKSQVSFPTKQQLADYAEDIRDSQRKDRGAPTWGRWKEKHSRAWQDEYQDILAQRYAEEEEERRAASPRSPKTSPVFPDDWEETTPVDWADDYDKKLKETAGKQPRRSNILEEEEKLDALKKRVARWRNRWHDRRDALRMREAAERSSKKTKIKIRPGSGELITSFEVQSRLNPEIWRGDKIHPEIRERLREIAEEFIEKLDLTNVEIKDIILTGSLANYNWSKYSDLDVHIVIDFKDVAEDEGLVKKYFDAVRSNWNRNHDIKVKGYEVELYVQDDDEKHASTGIYSLPSDAWVLKPSREQKEIDKVNIFKKARHIMREIDKVEKHLDRREYDTALATGQRVKDKIKKMRRGGLERGGVYSTENLAFKVLRRGGYMGKLFNAVGTAYDAQRSLAEQE